MNLLLTTTSALLRIITSSTAGIDVHTDWVDLNTSTGAITPGATNTQISSATTTTIVASPASSVSRNIKGFYLRNTDASAANTVTVLHTDGTTSVDPYRVTLMPNDTLEFVEGVGFFPLSSNTNPVHNQSSSSQAYTTSEIYLVGSALTLPASMPVAGTEYRCRFDMTKSAGTGSPVVKVYFGTNGSVADTAIHTFTFGVGTSVADLAIFDIYVNFRTVGSGTSAVTQGQARFVNNLATTGFGGTTANHAQLSTSAGFNSTTASAILGCSFNGSTAFAGTAQLVRSEIIA